jgi:hypothetical protein
LGDEPSRDVGERRGRLRDYCLTVLRLQGCKLLGERDGGLVALIEVLEHFFDGVLHRGYLIYYKV